MTRGNRACQACRTRMLATFRPSRHVRWSGGVSLTCPQQVVRVVLVEFGERHDKRTQTGSTTRHARHPRNKLRGCLACWACPRGCYNNATRKLLSWNLGLFHGKRLRLIALSSRFSAVVASFVARTKLLNVEPG